MQLQSHKANIFRERTKWTVYGYLRENYNIKSIPTALSELVLLFYDPTFWFILNPKQLKSNTTFKTKPFKFEFRLPDSTQSNALNTFVFRSSVSITESNIKVKVYLTSVPKGATKRSKPYPIIVGHQMCCSHFTDWIRDKGVLFFNKSAFERTFVIPLPRKTLTHSIQFGCRVVKCGYPALYDWKDLRCTYNDDGTH
eukprot:137827_1